MTAPARPSRVAVIGGGIAGLAAAWTLAERLPGARITVYEGTEAVGGKLRVAEVAGVAVDVGAEAMLAVRPEGLGLARAVGLDDALIAPLTTAARIWAGGRPHPLPARTMLGVPADLDAVRASGLFDAEALGRIDAEQSAAPLSPLVADVAVGAVVRERLGAQVLDRLVEPLLGGVYAGRADELSLQATMPALFARLRDGGSLVRAAQESVDTGPREPRRGPVFASLSGGLGRLPAALAASGRFDVRTGALVRGIERLASGFRLTLGPVPEPEYVELDAIVVATPAAKAARLLATVCADAARELAAIQAASMAIVTLAYCEAELPPGSGLLVAAGERASVKAVTLSTQKWPIDSGGVTVLRTSIGRHGDAQALQRDDAELVALARRDLRTFYGLLAEPLDSLVTRWGGGLPQYAVGHVDRVARIRAAVATVPGLAIAGASYDGVGIPACVASATAAADRIASAPALGGE